MLAGQERDAQEKLGGEDSAVEKVKEAFIPLTNILEISVTRKKLSKRIL